MPPRVGPALSRVGRQGGGQGGAGSAASLPSPLPVCGPPPEGHWAVLQDCDDVM